MTLRELILRPFVMTDADEERLKRVAEERAKGLLEAQNRREHAERHAEQTSLRRAFGTQYAPHADLPPSPSAAATDVGRYDNDLELGGGDVLMVTGVDDFDPGDFEVFGDEFDEHTAGLVRREEDAGRAGAPAGVLYSSSAIARRACSRPLRRADTLQLVGRPRFVGASLRLARTRWTPQMRSTLARGLAVLGPDARSLALLVNTELFGENWTRARPVAGSEAGTEPTDASFLQDGSQTGVQATGSLALGDPVLLEPSQTQAGQGVLTAPGSARSSPTAGAQRPVTERDVQLFIKREKSKAAIRRALDTFTAGTATEAERADVYAALGPARAGAAPRFSDSDEGSADAGLVSASEMGDATLDLGDEVLPAELSFTDANWGVDEGFTGF